LLDQGVGCHGLARTRLTDDKYASLGGLEGGDIVAAWDLLGDGLRLDKARVSYPFQTRRYVEVELPKGSLDQVAAYPVGAGLHLLAQLGFELADSLFDRFRALLLES